MHVIKHPSQPELGAWSSFDILKLLPKGHNVEWISKLIVHKKVDPPQGQFVRNRTQEEGQTRLGGRKEKRS